MGWCLLTTPWWAGLMRSAAEADLHACLDPRSSRTSRRAWGPVGSSTRSGPMTWDLHPDDVVPSPLRSSDCSCMLIQNSSPLARSGGRPGGGWGRRRKNVHSKSGEHTRPEFWGLLSTKGLQSPKPRPWDHSGTFQDLFTSRTWGPCRAFTTVPLVTYSVCEPVRASCRI